MNQTKKRLTIINLAISMTDMDTIQLQISKLALLKSDLKIVEILSALNGESYGQAQRLISQYIDAPNETVLQRTTQDDIPNEKEKQASQQEVDEATIDEFELFTTPSYETSQSSKEEVNYDAFLDTTTETKKPIKEINYDPLLNVEADDVLANNIDIVITQKHDKNLTSEESITNETKDNNLDTEEDCDSSYEAIPHINNKFNNLYTQYPPIEHTQSRYYSVENWLLQVSTKGYTETEVEACIKDAEELKQTNLGESAQLLIAAGATDSLYALFKLARALFIGDILQKNIPEAVTLIHYLAINEEYPEAICDLAQFYEQGVEVEKDKKKAEVLYKQAMHLGIQRAGKHYQRIQKENKSFFSIFKK